MNDKEITDFWFPEHDVAVNTEKYVYDIILEFWENNKIKYSFENFSEIFMSIIKYNGYDDLDISPIFSELNDNCKKIIRDWISNNLTMIFGNNILISKDELNNESKPIYNILSNVVDINTVIIILDHCGLLEKIKNKIDK